MAVLVIAEHDNQVLQESTLNAVTAALEIDTEVSVLVAGRDCRAVAEAAARVQGVTRILVCDHEAFQVQLAYDL